MAWQPAAAQADAQSSGVQTAGWHSAGSQSGEILQVSYTEPSTSPVDNSGQLRWKARRAKPAADVLPVKLTSATEPALAPVSPKAKPLASSSTRPANRYKWGKLGMDPWGDLGLDADASESSNSDSADSESAGSDTADDLDAGLARLSTIQQTEGQMPIDSADEGAKTKSVPPLAIPDGGDAANALDGAEPRTAQRRAAPTMPQMPNFEDAFVQGPQSLEVDCDRERQKLKPINAITNKIAAEPGDFPPECNLGDPPYKPRCYPEMVYAWKASNLCHKPLYFEQPAVERYGHALPPFIQPLASGAHFFVDVLLLPYHMGLELPQECVYSLGYYRPGSCAPMHIDGFPISARAAAFQAGAILSGTAIFGSFTAF